ncbi:MAG: hypothetical protein WC829_19250 [Hyphomicrobium sp.]|jgi:hypothetical protein
MREGKPAPRWTGLRGFAACFALALGGCASTISTPLPDLPTSHISSAMSPQEHQKAVDELTRARDTHALEAEKQIESSR